MSAPSPPVASFRLSSSSISTKEMRGAPSSSVSLSTGIFKASKNPKKKRVGFLNYKIYYQFRDRVWKQFLRVITNVAVRQHRQHPPVNKPYFDIWSRKNGNNDLKGGYLCTYCCSVLTSVDVNILPQSLILLQVLQEVLVLSEDKKSKVVRRYRGNLVTGCRAFLAHIQTSHQLNNTIHPHLRYDFWYSSCILCFRIIQTPEQHIE